MPLNVKTASIHKADETRKQTLYGIGMGYDYTLYAFSHLNFFIGLNADYQWYQNRWDFHRIYDVYEKQEFQYKKEDVYFYWDRIKGISLTPNLGIRHSTNKFTSELKLNLAISKLQKESYSFSKTRNVSHEKTWATWENFHPERKTTDLIVQSGILISLFYHF